MIYAKLFEEFVLQDLESEFKIELEIWDNGEYLELSKIIIPRDKRGTGVGSKVMQKIVDYADSVRKDIRLTPTDDFGATSINRLKRFYSKFGFEKNRDYRYKDTMVRYSK